LVRYRGTVDDHIHKNAVKKRTYTESFIGSPREQG
jgi:hypothetical protein